MFTKTHLIFASVLVVLARGNEIAWDVDLFDSLLKTLHGDHTPCLSVFGDFPALNYPIPIMLAINGPITAMATPCPDSLILLDPDEVDFEELGPFKAGYHVVIFFTKPVSRDYLNQLIHSKALSNILDLALISPDKTDPDQFLVHTHDIIRLDDILLLDVWRRDRGFLLDGKGLFAEDMLNLHGRKLTGTGFDFPPFVTLRTGGPFEGIEFKTFKDIANAMNFEAVPAAPKGGSKWAGVISDVVSREADFGVSHLFLTYGRAAVMDYTPAFNNDYFCFLVHPGKPYPRWMGLILPLQWSTWLFTVITCAICTLFVIIYGKYYKYAEMGPNRLAFYLYGTFLDHSHMETFQFRNHGMKLFILCFLMCFFVLTTGYRGSLISYFTAPYLRDPLNSIKHIVESPLVVRSLGVVVKQNLYLSPDPLILALDAKYEIHNSLDEGFKNVSEEKNILLESYQMSKFKIANEYTDSLTGEPSIHIARECMQHFPIVFYMPKNNIFTKPVSIVTERLKEGGFTLKRLQDVLGKTSNSNERKEKTEEGHPLSIFELQGAFLIVLTFNAVCFIIFIIELIASRMIKRAD